MNKLIPLLIYFVINFLFIWKYGSRLGDIYLSLIVIVFIATIISLIKFNNRNKLFWPISIIGLILVLSINIYVDCESLNVDRCSALSLSIEEILNSNYPYTSIDHLGGRSSHLPGLLILAAPFYLLGDVGYLQFGVLSLFIYAVYKRCSKPLLIISLLFISPAYWWEVYSKSDLLSNFLLLASAYLLLKDRLIIIIKKRPYLSGIVLSALFLTRFNSLIPLAILIIPFLLIIKKEALIKLIIGGMVGMTTMILIIHPWQMDIDTLLAQNPIELQNRFVPMWLAIGLVVASIYVGWKRKLNETPHRSISLLLLVPILFSMGVNVLEGSFYNSVINSSFDISYFNMVLPFAILWVEDEHKRSTT